MRGWDPLLVETLTATAAATALGAGIALFYWLMTGVSPWPALILGEMVGLGFGGAGLALSTPRRRR